jgi:hypothetical protein
LRGEQQQDQPQNRADGAAPPARQADEYHARHQASRQPGDHHPPERLRVASGQLKQRQRIVDRWTDAEPVQTAQYV